MAGIDAASNVPTTNAVDANLWNIIEGPLFPTSRETRLGGAGLWTFSIVNDK
jgi:hypothetical protein